MVQSRRSSTRPPTTEVATEAPIEVSIEPPSADRFHGLLEAAPDAMVVVGADGRIEQVNDQAERVFGYTRDELQGEPVEILVPERFQRHHPARRAGFVHDMRPRPIDAGIDLSARRKDGSEFPAEISLRPMDTDSGRVIIAAIRDATPRRAVERALAMANRELDAFSYSIAHNLRAPLRGMTGFAQVLLDTYHDQLDAEACDYLGEIVSNAQEMSGLIDALLSLARVARVARGALRRERIDLTAIASASASQLAAREPDRRVTVAVADRLSVDADPDLARTVIDHLLDNAWKFTRRAAAPRIEVGATGDDERTALFVRDNGAGFDMALANKLFMPFQRLHTVAEFPGTGIGLASVQRILHRHGGEIWADARIDHGATFYFTFHGHAIGDPP